MEKRRCDRFIIPGTTLYYKKARRFFGKSDYADDYYPVLDISRGGLKFLNHDRITPGSSITLKISFPGVTREALEIKAVVRWISRNREESYRYQTGVSFNAYGKGKKDNPAEILSLIKSLESEYIADQS